MAEYPSDAGCDRRSLCRAYRCPLIDSINDVVQPDLVVVLNEHLERIEEKRIVGAPDIVVKILSPSTSRTDRVAKAALYARNEVPEYWLVDPIEETVSVQRLEGDRFVLEEALGRGDILRSSVLDGFELDLNVIFPDAPSASSEQQTEET